MMDFRSLSGKIEVQLKKVQFGCKRRGNLGLCLLTPRVLVNAKREMIKLMIMAAMKTNICGLVIFNELL